MKLQEVKKIAAQILALAGELLRLVNVDEKEHRSFIEELKKMLLGKRCFFQA